MKNGLATIVLLEKLNHLIAVLPHVVRPRLHRLDIEIKRRIAVAAGVVRFAAVVGDVTGVVQHARQQHQVGRRFQTSHVRQSPNASSGEQHRAARQANGRRHRSHAVHVAEMKALLDEAIQIGRLNLVVSQRVDRVPALVIGKNEQDVWGLTWLRGGDRCRKA